MCLGVLCSPPKPTVQIKYLFFSLARFSPGIHNTRKKLINNCIWIKRFKDVIYLFCCLGHLKHFLENYVFCQKSGNDTCSRRWGRGESHVVCVIMTHSLYLNTFETIEKCSLTIMIKTGSRSISQ